MHYGTKWLSHAERRTMAAIKSSLDSLSFEARGLLLLLAAAAAALLGWFAPDLWPLPIRALLAVAGFVIVALAGVRWMERGEGE